MDEAGGGAAKVIPLTRPVRLRHAMRKLRALCEHGRITWSIRLGAELAKYGLDVMDLEHLFETGSIIEEEVRPKGKVLAAGGPVRVFVIGGLSADGLPAKFKVEVRGRIGVILEFEWQKRE